MIQAKKEFFCGNVNTFGIKIKILNLYMGKFSDCIYKIFLGGKEYGIYDETLLDNHNFIECNMLVNDIQDVCTLFLDNNKNIIDLTEILKEMSVENAIKQVIRYHFCLDMNSEPIMNYSSSIDDFKQKLTSKRNKSEFTIFIMNGHDSMKNYYFIPYYFSNELYLAIVEEADTHYENFDCRDDYDWNYKMCTHVKINEDYVIKILRECYNVLAMSCPTVQMNKPTKK